MNIARTTLSSKVLSQDKDYFANLAVDAVLRLKVRVLPSGYVSSLVTHAGAGIDGLGSYSDHQKSRRKADRFIS
jgi:hypothetical protein